MNDSGFNPFAAGHKLYGMGRTNPTSGPVDKAGYRARDLAAKRRRNAILRMLQAQQGGNYMSKEWLGQNGIPR